MFQVPDKEELDREVRQLISEMEGMVEARPDVVAGEWSGVTVMVTGMVRAGVRHVVPVG